MFRGGVAYRLAGRVDAAGKSRVRHGPAAPGAVNDASHPGFRDMLALVKTFSADTKGVLDALPPGPKI